MEEKSVQRENAAAVAEQEKNEALPQSNQIQTAKTVVAAGNDKGRLVRLAARLVPAVAVGFYAGIMLADSFIALASGSESQPWRLPAELIIGAIGALLSGALAVGAQKADDEGRAAWRAESETESANQAGKAA